jgi:hypothetical protein
MATDFAPGGATKIPCAKEAPDYTVGPWSSKRWCIVLPLTSRDRDETLDCCFRAF